MYKIKAILTLFFLLFLSLQLHAASTQDVLLIQSYHKGYKWSDEMSGVFEQKFEEQENVFLTTVYMDTKKIATFEYFQKLFELYKEQFRERKFDLIVVADNHALEFYMHYGKALFADTPLVFWG